MKRVKIPHSRLLDELAQNFEGLRREFGNDIDFAIDGHEGAEPNSIPVSEAVAIADALSRFRLRFYEEPLAYTNLEGYCELRNQSSIPIAGGESLAAMEQFHPFIQRKAVDLIQPDLGFVGGLSETVQLIHHAEAFNAGAALHTGAAVGPVLAASWHLAAACASVEWLETVVAPRSIQQDFLVDSLEIKDGCLCLPTAPGMGTRLTPELRQKYRFIRGSGQRT